MPRRNWSLKARGHRWVQHPNDSVLAEAHRGVGACRKPPWQRQDPLTRSSALWGCSLPSCSDHWIEMGGNGRRNGAKKKKKKITLPLLIKPQASQFGAALYKDARSPQAPSATGLRGQTRPEPSTSFAPSIYSQATLAGAPGKELGTPSLKATADSHQARGQVPPHAAKPQSAGGFCSANYHRCCSLTEPVSQQLT